MALETVFARPDLHCTPLNKVTLHRIIRFLSASLQIHFLDFIIHRGIDGYLLALVSYRGHMKLKI